MISSARLFIASGFSVPMEVMLWLWARFSCIERSPDTDDAARANIFIATGALACADWRMARNYRGRAIYLNLAATSADAELCAFYGVWMARDWSDAKVIIDDWITRRMAIDAVARWQMRQLGLEVRA